MDCEVLTSEEFAARLDEAIAYRVDNYGLRSARKLVNSVDAIRELLGEAYYYAAENGSAAYYQKAVAQYRALLDSGFSSVTTYRNLAVCYQEAGNYSQAETTLNQMIAAYPDDYNGYMLRCFLILKEEPTRARPRRNFQEDCR